MFKFIRSIIATVTLVSFTACSSLPISENFQKSIFQGAKDKFFNQKNRWNDGSANWKKLQDRSLNDYLTRVGETVRKQTQVPTLEYVVVDTSVVQAASAYDTSTIFVTLGMLNSI
jgi:hypothetical protein